MSQPTILRLPAVPTGPGPAILWRTDHPHPTGGTCHCGAAVPAGGRACVECGNPICDGDCSAPVPGGFCCDPCCVADVRDHPPSPADAARARSAALAAIEAEQIGWLAGRAVRVGMMSAREGAAS